jgi:hypothetical protein
MSLLRKLIIIGFFAIPSCAQPQPIPTPPPPIADAAPPAPTDPFSNQIYDCHGLDLVQRGDALLAAKGCLMAPNYVDCMLAEPYSQTIMACTARDVGADANAAVLAGSTEESDKTIADNARAFIRSHNLGYK